MPTTDPARPGPGQVFDALVSYLNAPPPRVITDWPGFVHPHAPPDDAQFPTPYSETGTFRLMESLPRIQRVVCALTAGELLDAAPRRTGLSHAQHESHRARHRRTLDAVRDWIDARPPRPARNIGAIANPIGAPWRASDLWLDAIGAVAADGIDEHARGRFLRRWWALCRCRLAFADASSAELD